MANNLVTKLVLDTKEFDNNIAKSTSQVRNMQSKFNDADKNFKNFTKGITGVEIGLKAIPWAAAIKGAFDFAKMGVQASQASDMFEINLGAARDTLQSFAGAVVSMDWDAFNGGLLQAFRNAKEFKEIMDELGDTILSKSVFDARVQNEFNDALNDARDSTLSLTERQEAYNKAKEKQIELENRTANAINTQNSALQAMFKSQTGLTLNSDELIKIAENFDLIDKYASIYNKTSNMMNSDLVAMRVKSGWNHSEFSQYAKAIYKLNDDERKQFADFIINSEKYNQQIISNQRTINRLGKSLNGKEDNPLSPNKNTFKTQKEQIDTIQKLKANVNSLKDQWLNASDALQKYNLYMEYQRQLSSYHKIIPRQIKPQGITVPTKSIDNKQIIADMKARAKAILDEEKANRKLAESYAITSYEVSMLASNVSSISDNPGIRALASSLAVLAAVQGVVEATGWVQKLVAIASLTAATVGMFSSLNNKKFANGGIVGDRNIVRVNQGEMILNPRQQQRLFQQLSSNSFNNNSNQSNISFVLRGEELIGVQNNYNSKYNNNRKYGYIN